MSSETPLIAEQLGLRDEIRELKLGKSFRSGIASPSSSRSNGKSSSSSALSTSFKSASDGINQTVDAFHTIRYDFKPVSVDTSKKAIIEFGHGNQVTVTAPNTEGSGHSESIFTGSRKPHLKECVLIIDHETGEITLERLSQQITVKQTRTESKGSTAATTETNSQDDPFKLNGYETSVNGSLPLTPSEIERMSSDVESSDDNEDQQDDSEEEGEIRRNATLINGKSGITSSSKSNDTQAQNNSISVLSMPQFSQLNDDLCLSESGSDSD